jgi:hypothetical protein
MNNIVGGSIGLRGLRLILFLRIHVSTLILFAELLLRLLPFPLCKFLSILPCLLLPLLSLYDFPSFLH